jgi:hypothetical protein
MHWSLSENRPKYDEIIIHGVTINTQKAIIMFLLFL